MNSNSATTPPPPLPRSRRLRDRPTRLAGVLLVLWSFLTPATPDRRTLATLTGATGAALLGIGLWSSMSASGDASIGGGILVLASVPLGVLALLLLRVKPAHQ